MSNQGFCKFMVILVVFFQILTVESAGDLMASPQTRFLTFRKGDAIRLTIWQPWQIGDERSQLDLNGDYLIDSGGYVFLPIVGHIKVVGHSTESLAQVIKEKYSPYIQDPIVVVKPLIRVTMQGAFNRPGSYLIPPDASLWRLVDLAGGPSVDSNLKKMRIERGGRVVKKNLLGGFEQGYSLEEIGITSGDQILVPERARFGLNEAFQILNFGITLLNLYIIVQRL